MGYYINHPTLTKEDYLEQNGVECDRLPAWPPPEGLCFIFLVDNGPFTAAAIAYDKAEYDDFSSNPRDTRPVRWFMLNKSKAVEFGADGYRPLKMEKFNP